MKRKILSLVFAAAMTLGLAKTSGGCETMSVKCPDGMDGGGHGGWTGIVCDEEDFWFYTWYYCTEEPVKEG